MLPSSRRGDAVAAPGLRRALGATLTLAVLVGCEGSGEFRRYGGSTMGTYYQVTARCPEDVKPLIEDNLRQVNAEMSTYLPDSTLSRFNAAPVDEWFPVTEHLVQVVAAAEALSRESAGAFDVTVGPLVNLWGFGPDDAGGVPADATIAATLARIGHRHLALRERPPALRKSVELYVDLSAIAKGHGVDRLVDALARAGCDAMLVDIGGEVRGSGPSPADRPWRIGIEVPDPASMGDVQRVVIIDEAAVATSGDYRNFREDSGRRYVHTIDPRTGYPVEHALASVSVVHGSAMWADGYATLLSVLGPEQGLAFARRHDLAALFIVRRDAADAESPFEERYTDAFAALLAE